MSFFGLLLFAIIIFLVFSVKERREAFLVSARSFAMKAGILADKSSKKGGRDRRKKTAVPVEVTPLITGRITDEAKFTGSLESRARFIVASRISGQLKRLTAQIGDIVSSGDLIAELDDEEHTQDVAEAEAQLAIARANLHESQAMLDNAKKEYERAMAMRKQKVTSKAEVESAQAQLKVRQARHQVNKALVSQREASVKASKIRLSYTQIKAVWSHGDTARHVGEKYQDEGALLRPNDPIVSLLDLATMTAVLDVVERDYYRIKPGQIGEVIPAAVPGKKFSGRIVRIAPFLNKSTRQARVEMEISNSDYVLKPGMFVTVLLRFATHHNALLAPVPALIRRGNQFGLFLADFSSQKAIFHRVKTGIVQNDMVEIASPTLSGHVVILGHHLLENGAKILVADPGKKGAKKKNPKKVKGKKSNTGSTTSKNERRAP
ncbi:efflux RND transporter periplasmic adaptor subunit [Candidatus Riflebacteria bacterium]